MGFLKAILLCHVLKHMMGNVVKVVSYVQMHVMVSQDLSVKIITVNGEGACKKAEVDLVVVGCCGDFACSSILKYKPMLNKSNSSTKVA